MSKTIYRIVKDNENPYIMVNKGFLQDERLSWKSKGLLTYLLSLPDDWKIYETEIMKHSTDGRDSTRSGIKELIKLGYMERQRIRNEDGSFNGYEYLVYEVSTKNGLSNNGKPENGKSNTTNNNLTNNKSTNNNINLTSDSQASLFVKAFEDYFGYAHRKIIDYKLNDIIFDYDDKELYDMYIKYFEKYSTGNKKHDLEKCSINNVFESIARYKVGGEW
jgi:hypothetical protein